MGVRPLGERVPRHVAFVICLRWGGGGAVLCGPVARLDGQVIGPAAGKGCLDARGLLEGTEKPWATGKGVGCAETRSVGLDGLDAVFLAALPVWGCGSRERSRRTQSNLC